MEHANTKTTTAANRSRSMILQPEDIVALTAEQAIADIEEAMRALAREARTTPDGGRPAGEHHSVHARRKHRPARALDGPPPPLERRRGTGDEPRGRDADGRQ